MRAVYAELPEMERITNLPRVHVEADYHAELGFEDEVLCTARVDMVGKTSIGYGYELRRPEGELAVSGRIVVVAVGDDGRPRDIPEPLRAALQRDG